MSQLPPGFVLDTPKPQGLPDGFVLDDQPMAWGDVLKGAVTNAPASAGQLAVDTVQPILHPIDTAKSIGKVVAGAAQKVVPGIGSGYVENADAVGEHFKNRYGGMENFKKTIATDPVGLLADASIALSGGGAAAARVPGVVGTTARAASTVGRAVDPFLLAGKGVSAGAKGVSDLLGGLGTHTGGQSVRTAAQSGFAGGERAEAFRDSMRGSVPMEGVVEDAKRALGSIRAERGADYRAGMAGVKADSTVLDFAPIDAAYAKASDVKKFKGVELSESTTAVRDKINTKIQDWKALDPKEYHTAEGLDALKQSIGDIKDSLAYGTPERAVATAVYGSIRDTIVKQAPDYAKTMKGYEQGSALIKEMEKTLSLNPKATVDTSLRKLQSVMRDNANTNYGKRADLAKILTENGAPHLMEKLAGQSMAPLTPRGLGKVVAGGVGAGSFLNPAMLAALPAMSPRIVGEAAHAGGRVARVLSKPIRAIPKGRAAIAAALMSGRTSEDQ